MSKNVQYVVRMSAGLANRMFQYSYYLYLKKNGLMAFVDNNYKATEWEIENIEWERIFPDAVINQASQSLIFKYGGGYSYLDKIRRHYLHFLCKVWIAKDSTIIPSQKDLSKYRYFIGVFQDASFINSIKNEVYNAFKFTNFEKESFNANLASKIKSENSVSIHIRKGKDYLKYDKFKNTCPYEYYKEAINIVESKVNNPIYYVFTDNPEWVKENFKDIEYTLVNNNPSSGWGNHFDLQLMSCCKHNIIANSTYSWWGAFLNQNPQKIVIEPKYWFNPQLPKYRNIINKTACEGWILL